MTKKITGTIIFDTPAQAALWKHELVGQFSDGMWENSGPRNHWKFWCSLEIKVLPMTGGPRVITDCPWMCCKTGYNIASLYPVVGERMVRLGRMAMAMSSLGKDPSDFTYEHRVAAENMPETMVGYLIRAGGDPRLAATVTPELATAYYTTNYTMKHLRADVASIKAAMKSVKR